MPKLNYTSDVGAPKVCWNFAGSAWCVRLVTASLRLRSRRVVTATGPTNPAVDLLCECVR